MMYPNMLILVSLSLAKSLSLSAFSAHFFMFFIDLNFSPKSFVDNTNLISLYICLDVLELVHPLSLTIPLLGWRCLVCYVWSNTIVFPLHFCMSHVLQGSFCPQDSLITKVSGITFPSWLYHQSFAPNS